MSIFKPVARLAAKAIPPSFVRPFGRPAMLYFHGVEATLSGRELEGIHHQADIFGNIATRLKNAFDILPMSAIGDVLRNPGRHPKALFLTFDDGYANNMLAADILERLGLPWTLFVSTHHIDTGETDPVFMARLFFMYAEDGDYEIPHFARPVTLAKPGQRRRAMDRGVNLLKGLDANRADEALAAMKEYLGKARIAQLIAQTPAKSFLSWDQIRALAARGVEIGSHASVHWPIRAVQSEEYIRVQTQHSKARIEAEVGPCRTFAYPFGRRMDCAAQSWKAVRDAGYEYAFTAIPGTLEADSNPWLLPRYGVGINETALEAMIPLLSANNGRLQRWQQSVR